MTPETLEALLIDRALGQLSPEMEALLAEYLSAHPESASAAGQISETVSLATGAFRRAVLPPLELPPRLAPSWPSRRASGVLALAASFVVGASVSFFALRAGSPPLDRTAIAFAQKHRSASPSPEVERSVRSLPFWSKQRVYLLAQSKQTDHLKTTQ